MKNQTNLNSDVKKLSKFSNGMKTIHAIFIAVIFSLIIPSVSSAATVTTFATVGNNPSALAFDTAGNLYTANKGSGTVSKIDSSGNVITFATVGDDPSALVFDTSGNLYTANDISGTVSKITPSSTVTTFATVGIGPSALAFDTAGNLYTANRGTNNVSKITPSGTVTTFATVGAAPIALAFDTSGNLYTANNNSGTVSKITPSSTVTTFATVGTAPIALAFDTAGNLYTANAISNTVSKITLSGTINVSSNISSSWIITGPQSTPPISGSGTSASYTYEPLGTYTITWGAVTGYNTPAPQSLTLVNDGDIISFNGTYGQNCGTVTDIDGNTYNTVVLGTQCWMTENLRTTKAPDGTPIIRHCYTGDSGHTDDPNCTNTYGGYSGNMTYGGLYDWATATNQDPTNCNTTSCPLRSPYQGICPTGWHVPTDAEWTTLSGSYDGNQLQWGPFSGILAGDYLSGNFVNRDSTGLWWSSTEATASNAWNRALNIGNSAVGRGSGNKASGYSVRCLKDDFLPPPPPPPTPTVEFSSVTPITINVDNNPTWANAPGTAVTLSWIITGTGTTTCTKSANNGGSWSGTTNASGSDTVYQNVPDVTYTLTCTDSAGDVISPATQQVVTACYGHACGAGNTCDETTMNPRVWDSSPCAADQKCSIDSDCVSRTSATWKEITPQN
jgi:uncharacterized protein (TIGR02145 family)